jgi:hypothetical protein
MLTRDARPELNRKARECIRVSPGREGGAAEQRLVHPRLGPRREV